MSDIVLESQNAFKKFTILQFGASDSSGVLVHDFGQFESRFCARPPEEYSYAAEEPSANQYFCAV